MPASANRSVGTEREAAPSQARDGRGRTKVLYLAPWVDYGGTAKGTLDWFKWLDRETHSLSLITTQSPSQNRLLHAIEPYASEMWVLPDIMAGRDMPDFILDFVASRGIDVVHIMNSRLGFDLLPDLSLLTPPPALVVQLHVEEDTRGGYVRYVSTRYGNLVDAFSVTSRHLARTMIEDYDVDPDKCHVIYTGVDADEEFSPEHVEPAIERDRDTLDILFLSRLVPQKDPMLLVEAADLLRRSDDRFRLHIVGYGELEEATREAVVERRLEEHVLFHGPSAEPARWLAACDVVLLTSIYEGIPYVVFEAMAMAKPVVGPALVGMVELMGDGCGRLIEPRDDVEAYAAALLELMHDRDERERLGREGRDRILERYSLERMARDHEELYRQLVSRRAAVRPGFVV